MDHARQTELIHRIFGYLDRGATTMAADVYRNPAADYTCPAQNAAERTRLFRQHPQVVAASADLKSPGDFVTDDHTGVPLLVVRGQDGALRAFVNACRHRGSRVAEGDDAKGRGHARRAFVCPFHGWAYGLDGAVAGIPYDDGFEGVDRACLALSPLPVAEKYGLVWVLPEPVAGDGDGDRDVDGDRQTIDPDRAMAGAEAEIGPLGLADFHPFRTEVRTRQANWKLIMDTFLETYHFPVLHRNSVNAVFMPNCGPFDPFGPNLRLMGVRRTIESLRDAPEADWDLVPHSTLVWLLFPNTVVVLQMGHLEIWRVFPGPDPVNQSVFELSLYAPSEPATDKARRHWNANMDILLEVTEGEDFVMCEQAQAAFRSGAVADLVFGRNEPALQHFHKAVKAALA